MQKLKICNAYSGIGGNRRLWPEGHHITAIENNPDIAKIYQEFYPNDTVIVTDAHQYLLEHFQEYDFIWSSPPCQSHSVCNNFLKGQGIFRYPDMKLWQEIIFLQHFYKGLYCIENVKPYYDLLIPGQELERHVFWTNFYINKTNFVENRDTIENIHNGSKVYGFDLSKYKINNKRQILRNLVNPEIGKYIFNCAFKNIQLNLLDTLDK